MIDNQSSRFTFILQIKLELLADMATRKKKVSINTRINEHPGVFRMEVLCFAIFVTFQLNGSQNLLWIDIVFQKDILKKNKVMKVMNKKKKQATISTINNTQGKS